MIFIFFLEIKGNRIITVYKETDFKIIFQKLKKYKYPYKIKSKNTINYSLNKWYNIYSRFEIKQSNYN